MSLLTFDTAKATDLLITTRRPVADIAHELGCSTNQLREWMPYSGISRQKLWGNNRAPGCGPKVAQTRYVERRLSAADRERRRYGELLPDVKFLQRRGFVIFKDRGGIRVDRRLLTAAQLHEVAERERRLQSRGCGV